MQEHPLLLGLNEAQREAVVHTEGPLLVLAGPGSGKTRVITHRIAWMIRHGIRAPRIAALTFTNKAADEMKKRLEILAPDQRIWIGTFHKFCSYLLRQYASFAGLDSNFTIYDTDESKKLLDLVLEHVELPTGINSQRIAAGISWAKNELIGPEEYISRSGSFLGQFVEKAYPEYQQALLRGNAVDFDDLLVHVAKILRENPELRAQLDSRFRYILVDEYQDTNSAQYAIARALSIDFPNLAVTGDPDQSIYGWRGANIRNILDFEKDFEQVKTIRLEQNYRSTQRILSAAGSVIRFNRYRKEKDLYTDNARGKPVRLVCALDQREEAEHIAKEIAREIAAGKRRPKDYAIFYRMNALSRNLEHALRREQVHFQLVRGLEFFSRKEIRDIIAYLQLINNTRDPVSFVRIINEPRRGIGKTTVGKILALSREFGIPIMDAARELAKSTKIKGMSGKVKKSLEDFVKMIDALSREASRDEYTLESLLTTVLEKTGYKAQYEFSEAEEDQQRLENIEELLTETREFDRRPLEPGENALEKFLEQVALINEVDAWENDSDRVSLMSLHAAKGLEFPVVYIVALEEKILPHERSMDEEMQLEEERRLFFVGMTRAKEELRISRTRHREYLGRYSHSIFSRFLMELPGEELTICESPDQIPDCPENEPFNAGKQPRLVLEEKNETKFEIDDPEIEYEDVHIEYDEEGNIVNFPKRSPKKKNRIPLNLTTAADLLKKMGRKPEE